MSEARFDVKEAIDTFKWLNLGGVLSVVVIAAVVGVMYGSGCGPVIHSKSYADPHPLTGAPSIQDHPEAFVADDHTADHAADGADPGSAAGEGEEAAH